MRDLISRQLAIEIIHGLYPSTPIMRCNRERWEEKYKPYIEAEKALEKLPTAEPEYNFDEWCTDCKEYDHEKHCCPRWNRVIRNALKDAQPEPRWIPVSERLPKLDEAVLVTTEWDDISIAWRIGIDKWYIHEGNTNSTTDDLTAWMPLPEPYRAERIRDDKD